MYLKMEIIKKSQILILSSLILMSFLIFIYYSETENIYIKEKGDLYLLNNIIYETCKVGKLSNGTNLDPRFQNITLEINNYCNSFGNLCILNIVKKATAPTNDSLLTYNDYDYSINFNWGDYTYSSNFNCD
jgi:hypothetical protein